MRRLGLRRDQPPRSRLRDWPNSVASHAAKSVTACDFMAVSIEENRRQHAAMCNVDFMVADVTKMEHPPASYDVVFSNWLLMYLSDQEVEALAVKALSWLSPGGALFFRESCFRPSGDKPRNGNPTHYRDPKDYSAMFEKAEVVSADGASVSHFDLVCCKCVLTHTWRSKKTTTRSAGSTRRFPVPALAAWLTAYQDQSQESNTSAATGAVMSP